MSIRLKLELLNSVLSRMQAACRIDAASEMPAQEVYFGYGPLHTHFSYIHSHKLVAKLRCDVFTANSSSLSNIGTKLCVITDIFVLS